MKRKSFVLVLLLTALLFLRAGCSMTQPSGESPSAPDSRTQEMDEEASNDSTINEFKRETSEISQKVDTVVPIENDMNEKTQQFNEIMQRINTLDQKIDNYENQIEADYQNQKLSERDYKVAKMDIEKADDDLGAVKENLENKFAMDD
ncbi:hypothetical protein [Eubacterium callanderi]|uniref:hypothetical protein n=1 Tax=Eubacterium callanderi TaxID=53442 RepID=UPI001C0FCED2|nr:hypothetical protein [Eubacterium callanderi]MBU5304518.1 hypothetical protein [Eubacterium callanderi]